MSPCGTDEACRCCHRFLVLLNVFTSFSCFSCSCVLDINFLGSIYMQSECLSQKLLFVTARQFMSVSLW